MNSSTQNEENNFVFQCKGPNHLLALRSVSTLDSIWNNFVIVEWKDHRKMSCFVHQCMCTTQDFAEEYFVGETSTQYIVGEASTQYIVGTQQKCMKEGKKTKTQKCSQMIGILPPFDKRHNFFHKLSNIGT